jgi:hypothetical protein
MTRSHESNEGGVMKRFAATMVLGILALCLAAPAHLRAQEGANWTKTLPDRTKRGTLHDSFQNVRGDTGKWNDEARLQYAPPVQQKPGKISLDDWADQLLEKPFEPTTSDDNWFIFRTRQLDDNDRFWVERIERTGNQLTVVAREAVWQGKYQKNFTYYAVLAVNLGKLEPGKYEAKWIIEPYLFNKFEPSEPPNAWPAAERAAGQKGQELAIEFTVVAPRE